MLLYHSVFTVVNKIDIPGEVGLWPCHCFHLGINYGTKDVIGCQIDVVFQIKIILHSLSHLTICPPDGGTILTDVIGGACWRDYNSGAGFDIKSITPLSVLCA